MFEVLREKRVIGKELAAKLEDMAIRNLLVHRYGEIDNKRVLEIIKRNLKDIQEFEKDIENFIKEE